MTKQQQYDYYVIFCGGKKSITEWEASGKYNPDEPDPAPLIVSGDIDSLKSLRELLLQGIHQCEINGAEMLGSSGVKWLNSVEQAINDEEFEQTQS